MKEIKLINIYLKYLDRKDALQKEHEMSFETLENKLKQELSNLSSKDLVTLYFEYATPYNFRKVQNIGELFDLIQNAIQNQLKELSTMKLIDLVAHAMACRATPKKVLDNNIRLAQNSSKLNEEELKSTRDLIKIYEKMFEYIEKLVDEIFISIQYRLENITDQELQQLLETLSSRIADNSQKIKGIYEHFANKKLLKTESNLNNVSVEQIENYLIFNVDLLEEEIYTYETYQERLLEKSKKK